MCLDCFFEDPNRAKIEEQRKQEQEKREKEELKRKQLKEQKLAEINSPEFRAIFNLAWELTKLRENNPSPLGVGNLCNREVYEFSSKLLTNCPKCNSHVNVPNESLTLNYEYDLKQGFKYLNRPGYMCSQVCLYDLKEEDLNIDCLDKTCQKKDEKGFYLAINGKKYYLPNNKDWKTLLDNGDIRRLIFREAMMNYDNYPLIVGGGGFFVRNNFVYSCTKCGLQYHLISISSFVHRDKSKDGIVEEIEENKENMVNKEIKEN